MSNQNNQNNMPPNFWDWVASNEARDGPHAWAHARGFPSFPSGDFNPLAAWAGPLRGMPYRNRRDPPFAVPSGQHTPPPPPPPPGYEDGPEHGGRSHPPPPPPPPGHNEPDHHKPPHHGSGPHGPEHHGPPHHGPGGPKGREPSPPSPPPSVPGHDDFPHPPGPPPHHPRHHSRPHSHERPGRGRGGPHGGPHRGRGHHGRGGHEHGPPRGRGSPPPFPFDLNELASQFLPHLFRNTDVANPFAARGPQPAKADGSFVPSVDVFDTPSRYLIHVSLPGAKKSDIDVSWNAHNSSIGISGVVHRPAGVDEEMLNTMSLDERQIGLFERNIKLGNDDATVDVDGIGAKLDEGVLIVTVPKLLQDEWTEVRKVDIE